MASTPPADAVTTATAPSPPAAPRRPGLWTALRVYLEPASLRMLLLGFSAGLPLLLVVGTLSFRLREAGIERSTIGFLSWVALAYGFKWAWAPLVDHLRIPWLTARLGRRRSWLLAAQLAIMAGLVGMALSDPRQQLSALAGFAVLAAFGSATQDIALDAYRIESANTTRQAALAAMYQAGYRLAMIWAGAGALWLAARGELAGVTGYQQAAWAFAYLVMAASMLLGMLTVLLSPEPARPYAPPLHSAEEWLREAVIAPFADFLHRYRHQALLILGLIALYRISDIVMGVMANSFYVDMGYTKDQIALVTKVYGLIMTLLGAFVGGWIAMRIGVLRVLMLGAVLSACTNLLFAWLSTFGPELACSRALASFWPWLATLGGNFLGLVLVISADNLAGGLASAAFIAYLSSLANVRYSATQYALFSSIMMLLPKWLGGFSGVAVDQIGYTAFFIGTACIGLPVLLLISLVARHAPPRQP
ncbi:MFS transporter [Corticibacter populi]|uniref:MFS transporter n=1 Tax=Corticibacter populi TaxID=1550736 RepID=A0A3M6QM89_9BURK|nr:MFS transporter [Corticibacter populi]RMX04167.1 MFS transporter [Corticibacter populi]RZS33189.1 PAT family beta-lactamase induction signal transducer AmpG [Corticibacter populi]